MADYNINAVTRRVVFSGSAGAGPYAFTFEILVNTDIAVYKNSVKLTLTTDYSVTINANGTGSVTLVVAATSDDTITIIGSRDIERTTDFVTAGDLLASSLNEQLDSQIIMIQQLAEENKRTIKAPNYDPADVADGGTANLVLPEASDRAGKTLAFDASGNPIVGEDIGNWRGDWAASVTYAQRDLVKDASNSNVYRANTAHTSSGSTPISGNADSAKWDLVVDAAAAASSATAAASSATAAAASESAASTSETNAASSASSASTSASNASTSATNAATSATSAATSATNAETAYDQFDDRYLGAKASDPTLDNDGDALVIGALYFNTTSNAMQVYTGSAWTAAYVSGGGSLASANNLSDVASASSSRTNLGLAIGSDVQAYSAVLAATTASFLTADETKLDGIEALADVTDETNVKAALDGATITGATVATGDKVLIQDINASNNLRTVTAQSIADLASGGGAPDGYLNYKCTSPNSIRTSNRVTSVTDNGVGDFTITWSSAFGDADYVWVSSSSQWSVYTTTVYHNAYLSGSALVHQAPTTTTCRMQSAVYASGVAYGTDPEYIYVAAWDV